MSIFSDDAADPIIYSLAVLAGVALTVYGAVTGWRERSVVNVLFAVAGLLLVTLAVKWYANGRNRPPSPPTE